MSEQSIENTAESDIDKIIDNMAESVPDVQQHVIDAEKAKIEHNNATTSFTKEESFDPNIHSVDSQGFPKKTKTGKFRKITGVSQKLNNPKPEPEKAPDASISLVAAETVQSLKRQLYDTFFDYKYGNDRHTIHVATTTTYFDSVGGVRLSPLQTLLLVEGAMFVELVQTEKAAKKVNSIKTWIVGKWFSLRSKKRGTQSNSWAKPERKVDDSEKTNEKTEK